MTARQRGAPRANVAGPGRRGGGKLALLSPLLTLAAIGDCSGSGGTAPETRPLRTGVEWQLVSIQPSAQPAVTVADPTGYTVRFGSDGSVSARVDGNRCGGRYRIEGAALTINPALACTRAACALPSLEGQFPAALTSVSGYVQRESELELVHAGGTLRFRSAP
jgi:heat shock protein HslJ